MQPLKVIFILGSGHCGATLMDLVLDTHSHILGVGEMHSGRPASICTCGKLLTECRFWQAAFGPPPWDVQAIYRPKLSYLFDHGPYYSAATHKPVDTGRFVAGILEDYRTLLALSGETIICDSSKEVERVEVLAASPDIEPIVLHLVRDGRGATWTYIDKYKKIFPFFYMWALSNIKIELFRRRFKKLSGGRGKFIYLRFGDFLNAPEATLRRLCTEIGIVYEPAMLAWDEHEHHGAEGNRTRFVKGHTIYPDTKARDMPLLLRVMFNICFGWLNLHYTRLKKSFVSG